MKVIAVYFTHPDEHGYPFDTEEYVTAYHELATTIRENGGRFVIVRGMESHTGGMTFSHYWDFDGTMFHRVDESVTADVLYDKGEDFPTDEKDVHFVNDPQLERLCSDKIQTAKVFAEFSPVTFVLDSSEDIAPALQRLSGDIVVAKPFDGAEGRGVFIGPKEDVGAKIVTFPYLLQEYIDTSAGIPGITDTMHDFRLVCVNEHIAVSFIRTPPEGSLISNVSLGGKEKEVLPEHIPQEVLDIHRSIDATLSVYGNRIYSIDFARGANGRWKVIELNSKPGLSPRTYGKSYAGYHEMLAKALLSA